MIATIPRISGSMALFEDCLHTIVDGRRGSLLDLCCCFAPVTGRMGFQDRAYVDVVERKLVVPSERPHFVVADVLSEHEVFNRRWQVVTCLDGIEHLTRPQGLALIEKVVRISDVCIFFTPLDLWPLRPQDPADPESHKSVWAPSDFPGFHAIVFPNYHPTLRTTARPDGIGAFFAWRSSTADDFWRVVKHVRRYWCPS